MLVPAKTYAGRPDAWRFSRAYEIPGVEFWPGEQPVPMYGSRNVRRWRRDHKYVGHVDGYLHDLADRYFQMFKPTVIGVRETSEFVSNLRKRITARYSTTSKTLLKNDIYSCLVDGTWRQEEPAAVALARLADAVDAEYAQ